MPPRPPSRAPIKRPTGARRAQFVKRAQIVFGLLAGAGLLYRMIAGLFRP